MFVKRVVKEAGGGPGVAAADTKFAEKHPATWEYLSLCQWEDGKPRKLSKLSLSIVEGRWTACFVDVDSNRLAFLSATTFTELLASLEKRLASDSMEWRPCKQWGKKP